MEKSQVLKFNGLLQKLPKEVKLFIGTFLVVLSVGYFSGLQFVQKTSGASPQGIQENYIGNENDEEAAEMKFKKSEREMLAIIHAHILSMALIFFILGGLVAITTAHTGIKKFLMIEPLLSVLLTFGGIYFMWKGIYWLRYVVMVSGTLMTLSYVGSVSLVMVQLFRKNKINLYS